MKIHGITKDIILLDTWINASDFTEIYLRDDASFKTINNNHSLTMRHFWLDKEDMVNIMAGQFFSL